jgi:2-polyprenyl-6-hydroxyphenyl methylase/3-demethylubiquinone-9 3-methyltransferase
MWEAIENVFSLVAPNGKLWISLYAKGPRFDADLKLKRKYNAAGKIGKRLTEWRWISRIMLSRLRHLKNPFSWNQKGIRGMNVYNDLIDWLGGLPYEVASEDEVVLFARQRGFILERIDVLPEGGCSTFVLTRLQ